ncbi:branched-chain amino acid ABC transporter permease [Xanthobacter sp. YC-JY1]|uniref:branched-chain amino acid ABC transporter permease n=1 Tax=Xanthobacter sp. YC-JY1 TaxID=2419844 RepID=UPI001F17E89C|nr:branched-chain amino acid ABC transporter permease [Xanthobacter sp. YC-JY1]UJX46578.1 branched-chain amino acid ABC transporter permease [Xanthobacter sp. YC-JY1]
MSEFLQLAFSGLTVGAIYALIALGFTLIYNASDVINFAQGDFVMIGGMGTVFLMAAGLALPVAALIAVVAAVLVGLLLHRLAIEPARGASPVTLIMITIGASIFIKGVSQIIFDKQFHSLPAFSGDTPIPVGGATILPQSLWVMGTALALVVALYLFLEHTLVGKAVLATAANRLAAKLVGINVALVLALAFGLSAAMGALAGVVATPITLTRYDIGTLFTLKGFAAAMLGGMGNPVGAVVGGLLIGLIETFTAGYLSSTYKDAVAFLMILVVLLFMPRGLFGSRTVERV